MPSVKSPISDLTDGSFQPVLGDHVDIDDNSVTRVVFCSGKLGHELIEHRNNEKLPVAVVRVEELFPFPGDLIQSQVAKYKNATEIVWAQEEPLNMGAASFIVPKIQQVIGDKVLRVTGRPESASPATGSATVHEIEQNGLIKDALN